MSISDYNLKGAQKNNLKYFATAVKLAEVDGVISEEELSILKKLAKKFHILNDKFKEIIENPNVYPINQAHNYDERIKQLFELSKMVVADNQIDQLEINFLKKLIIGLGFSINSVETIASTAIELVKKNEDLEAFTKDIKKVNTF
ncbi:MAG: TerB family tellurite resistance protein [Lutibacter sp.]